MGLILWLAVIGLVLFIGTVGSFPGSPPRPTGQAQ
ncbi:hypothetical protein J2X42_004622 [Arthrobacter sp. BE255]|nr:hypothetical protein [Arthrobacter sp. BE255]